MSEKITMEGKYQTRDGRAVRVLCVDVKHADYPVIALITDEDGAEGIESYTPSGKLCSAEDVIEYHEDLVPLKKKKMIYVNFYKNRNAVWFFNESVARSRARKDVIVTAVPVEIEVEV